MKKIFLLIVSVFFVLNSCADKMDTPAIMIDTSPIELSNINQTLLLQLINQVRSKDQECGDTFRYSVEPLVWNKLLERLAYNQSKDMEDNQFFSHTSSQGLSLSERLDYTDYTWKNASENIAQGLFAEKSVIDGWLKSPKHCNNIMNGSFTQVGIAKVGNHWTQIFTD